MRFKHDHDRKMRGRAVNAALVADQAQFYLHQLSLPIEPTDSVKARINRATRRAGLSPRKAVRIWYQHACTIAAHEFLSLREAYTAHICKQERRLAEEISYLRELQSKEKQHELGLTSAEARHDDLAKTQD